MKLLGWMHRKFRQNSTEPFKDLVIGQPALDDELNYLKPNFGSKHVKQSEKEQNYRKSFGGVEGGRVEDEDEYEEESSGGNGMYEVFHGFLTIGTLGSEQVAYTDPSRTPTFGFYVENITEKEDAVTENELKLINEELEKVLGAETKDDGSSYYDSSGRNSHVSSTGTGRSSLTLSGKPNGNGNESSAFCPLQGYLFGSAVELSETTTTAAMAMAKKEHRTSLGELFQRTKLAEDNFGPKDDNKKTDQREADKSASAMHLMKKKLKKRMLHTYSRTSSTSASDSASAEKKPHKILHMFHRKVHPDNPTVAQKNEKKKKKIIMNPEMGGNNKSDVVHPEPEEDIMLYPKTALAKYKSQSNPLQLTIGSEEDSWENENGEHWIKTDADYLVLEL